MSQAKYLSTIEVFVKNALADESSGHDWWHIERVRNNARAIYEKEKGDWETIELAVLLHDIGDRKVINKPDDDHTIAKRLLEEEGVESKKIEQIMFIIEHMSFSKSFDKKPGANTIEFQIVQDADRLDAIGAIGIGRVFTYGGRYGEPMYNPDLEAATFTSTAEYKNLQSSQIHHFEEKLFLLKDLMNTDTAKEIAEDRHQYLVDFKQRFLDEWHGKK